MSGLSQRFDLWLYDLTISLGPLPSAAQLPITIIGIDEADIRRYGWPIDDRLLCEGFDRLTGNGARAVGLDLYRDAGVGPNQACLRQRFNRDPRLVSIFNLASGIAAVPGTPPSRQAFNDLTLDADGTLRRDLVHVSGQDEATVALPLRLVEVAKQDKQLRQRLERGDVADAWLSSNAGGYHRDEDAGLGMQRMLEFREPGSFRTYSLSALLNGQIPDDAIANHIVLIGSTAPSLKDLFLVPMTHFRSGTELPAMPGVEVHALRVATMLELQSGQQPVGWLMPGWGNWLLVLAAAAGGVVLGESFRSLRRSVLATGGALVLLAGGLTLMLDHAIWIGSSMPLLALTGMASAAWLRRGAASQQHAKQVRELLGQATSPEVARVLWEERDQLLRDGRFEGKQLLVTVLFTDIANFTSAAERLEPAAVMAWIDRSMERCIPAVTTRGGMVNKFTGDGIMAVFGAPLSTNPAADAEAAVAAALAMREDFIELNQTLDREGLPAMRLRIGIHSGEVVAGSMGSQERLEYAVMGDTVNCASRLESLDKERHHPLVRILVSAETRALLSANLDQQIAWEEWGAVQVKGRREPLTVFELQDGQRTGN